MAREGRFAWVEVVMQGVSIVALLCMVALMGMQASIAATELSAQRAERHIAAMKWDLAKVAERQVLHYLDSSEFAASTDDLRFVSSTGVAVEVTGNASGWSAVASHERAADGHGCAVFYGAGPAPDLPVQPGAPGEIVCTQ